MRISGIKRPIESVLQFDITFNVADDIIKTVKVFYYVKQRVVACTCNTLEACEHIKFMQEFIDKSRPIETALFIRDKTQWIPEAEIICAMQRAFDVAVGKYGVLKEARRREENRKSFDDIIINTQIEKPRKPRKPKPFSLIELD